MDALSIQLGLATKNAATSRLLPSAIVTVIDMSQHISQNVCVGTQNKNTSEQTYSENNMPGPPVPVLRQRTRPRRRLRPSSSTASARRPTAAAAGFHQRPHQRPPVRQQILLSACQAAVRRRLLRPTAARDQRRRRPLLPPRRTPCQHASARLKHSE